MFVVHHVSFVSPKCCCCCWCCVQVLLCALTRSLEFLNYLNINCNYNKKLLTSTLNTTRTTIATVVAATPARRISTVDVKICENKLLARKVNLEIYLQSKLRWITTLVKLLHAQRAVRPRKPIHSDWIPKSQATFWHTTRAS